MNPETPSLLNPARQQPLPLLHAIHYVVLGRYNGKKTRPLTPATRIYRSVRKGIRRTKNLSGKEIQHIQEETTRLLREDKGAPDLPEVVFCVDVQKAGERYQHLEFLPCLVDYDGEEVFLVQDVDHVFLKLDVDSKRHTDSIASKPRAKVKTMAPIKTASIVSTASTVTTSASTVVSDAATQDATRFGLQGGTDLEEEMDMVCVRWIGEGPGVEAMKRKMELVEAYKEYFHYYETLLNHHNPWANSHVPQLRSVNDSLLAHFANQVGSSMVEWYEKYPDSCLKGEDNVWVTAEDLHGPVAAEQESHVTPMDRSTGTHDQGLWGNSPSDEDEHIMNATICLSECSLGSGKKRAASKKNGAQSFDSSGHDRMSFTSLLSQEAGLESPVWSRTMMENECFLGWDSDDLPSLPRGSV